MANNNFIVRNGLTIPSGNITMGNNASISVDTTTGALVLIPATTGTYPNPTGLIITAAGTLATVLTVNGVTTITNIDNSANASANLGASVSSTGVQYELDPITADGSTNLYPLYYNGSYFGFTDPLGVNLFLDGERQPGFVANIETTWLSLCNSAKTGYTIDNTFYSYAFNSAAGATGTALTNTITMGARPGNVSIGMMATGAGIVSSTTVTDVNTVTKVITLSNPLSATITNSNVTFSVSAVKFADAPWSGAVVSMETRAGVLPLTPKIYPFKPLDIMLGG